MKKTLFILLISVFAYSADIQIDSNTSTTLYHRAQPRSLVWVSEAIGYVFFIDSGEDLHYWKTTNSGVDWSEATVDAETITKFAIWYDKWTVGDTGTLIHIAYVQAGSDDVNYRNVDTFDDALSSEVNAITGTTYPTSSAWNENSVSIVKSRGGTIYIAGRGDSDGEHDFVKGNADPPTSFASRTTVYDGNADYVMLLAGDETDNDDVWAVYQDISANSLTLKVYDDTGNSWSESSSITTITEDASRHHFQYDCIDRHSDGHAIIVLWTTDQSATADLTAFDITDISTQTQLTDVISNSTTYSNMVGLLINQNTDSLYVAYGTATTSGSVEYAVSDDGGSSWNTGNAMSQTSDNLRGLYMGTSIAVGGNGRIQPCWWNIDLFDLMTNTVNSLEITLGTNWQVNISDAWKGVIGLQVNISDVWKLGVAAWINIGDSWKVIY